MKRIVILGAGTGGTMMANKLARTLPDWRITVLDRDDVHVYQPGLLFVPFGTYRPDQIVKRRTPTLDRRVELRLGEIDKVAPEENRVTLKGGESIAYDVLIVATGSRIVPQQTQGLTGPGWKQTAFDFYTLEGATALRSALDRFQGGRLVVNVVEMPIKCPVAPLEFLFLADEYFTRRGIRGKVDLVYATPLEGAFTKPKASALLSEMLKGRNIDVAGDFGVEQVHGDKRVLQAFDGRQLDYDLLVTVPLHAGSELISNSGMGDAGGWLPTDRHTLQSKQFPNVFAIGDATDLPSSKAGAVAHFQGEVLIDNVHRFIAGRPVEPAFDGHTNCFIETGFGKAMLIDFNYETEPLPGKFPLPGVGPLTLLGESEANHFGKLAFKWLYWNVLLPGRELPLEAGMSMAGKRAA
jgi:sulfide:quinone oxidoreductase